MSFRAGAEGGPPERPGLRVLYLAAEAEPFVKVGGLGDVAGSLPGALRRLPAGLDVRLAIPLHGAIPRQAFDLRPLATFEVPHAGGPLRAEVLQAEVDGLPVYLIGGEAIPPEAPVYALDPRADAHKFIFFSLAALELARVLGWAPDVVHANDWHAAPALVALRAGALRAGALRARPEDAFFAGTAGLLGVHNLPYQGGSAGAELRAFGLPVEGAGAGPELPAWAQERPLALGLQAAGHIVAPSPGYAGEMLTPEFGAGLDAFLRARAGSISGILNGMDTQGWDPSTDGCLAANFSRAELERRAANKAALQAELGLEPDPRVPLVAMISRLDPQKGVDLVPEALRQAEGLAWQAAVLGTGQPSLEAQARGLQAAYPGRARARICFDGPLSRRMYAGADLLLMPSRYEPCGLSHLIAMRYGCVPVARAVGGLRDTIADASEAGAGAGFLFGEATAEALAGALRRALGVYADPPAWRALQRRGMEGDYSWERSAEQYARLYQSLSRREA